MLILFVGIPQVQINENRQSHSALSIPMQSLAGIDILNAIYLEVFMNQASSAFPETETLSAIAVLVADLKNTFATGTTKDYDWRVEQLKQLKLMTEEQQDSILAALKSDLGKCKAESWTSEVGFIISDIDHTLKHLKKWI